MTAFVKRNNPYFYEWDTKKLVVEISNFSDKASLILPRKRDYPKLDGIDFRIAIVPYEGGVSGDYAAIVNFNQYRVQEYIDEARKSGNIARAETLEKNMDRVGILIADAPGHMITDSVPNIFLHGALKMGIEYELTHNGQITRDLFEKLNNAYHNFTNIEQYRGRLGITLIYGEIIKDGRFRFICAGHPSPIIFSFSQNRIINLPEDRKKASTPLGFLPSRFKAGMERVEPTFAFKEKYAVNELQLLGQNDILLLYTDGLIDQKSDTRNFVDARLEEVFKDCKKASAKEILKTLIHEVQLTHKPEDDLTLAVIKKL